MGFLHKLWDDTLAGPAPDTGLGKLRKYSSFSPFRPPSILPDSTPVSRSITILRTSSRPRFSFSVPDSPVGSGAPVNPVTLETPRCDLKRFERRKWEHQRPTESPERTCPTIFDWIVITTLDR